MSPLERSITRELRRNRLPIHVRRRQARRLAAAIEAEGYRVAEVRMDYFSKTSPAGLAGERFGTGMGAIFRAMDEFVAGATRAMTARAVADLRRRS